MIAGPPPALRIRFTATVGQTYTVQYRDSLSSGAWQTLTTVPAQSTTQTVEIPDSAVAASATRYYRISSP